MRHPLLLLIFASNLLAQQYPQVQPTAAVVYNSAGAPGIDQRQGAAVNYNGAQGNGLSNTGLGNSNGGVGASGTGHYQPFFGATASAPLAGGDTALQFAIRAYSDAGSRTPDGGFCKCPPGVNCGDEDRCSFTFTIVVSTPNQKSEVYEINEIRLDPNGDAPQSLASEWGRIFVVNLPARPSSLDILVHHRGLTYDDSGRPLSASKLSLVDRFHVDLEAVLPAVGGVQNMQASNDYIGAGLGTRMSLSLSLACSGQLIGPDCDLKCNRSTTISNVASCRSEASGYFAICNWAVGQMNQVENCQRCPWGVRDDTHCQDETGGVLYPDTAGVVDDDFRTATIALSIVLFVVVVLLGALVTYLCMKNRKANEKEAALPGHNVRLEAGGGAAARPLLQQTRYSHDSDHSTPVPAPRQHAPAAAAGATPPVGGVAVLPPKSALKKAPAPQAHLGGSNSVNESANTSYSDASRPTMMSRSAVV